jgi:hypothetical protein
MPTPAIDAHSEQSASLGILDQGGHLREADAWQPTVQSADELLRKVLPPVRWAVEGLLPEGVNLLAAKAKKGKSTLMLHIACAIAEGVKAMGHFATTGCEVLYLALEDNERRMQKRLRNMLQGEPAPKGLHFVYEWPPLDMGGDTALSAYLDAHPAIHVVVADTLEHIRPKRRSPTGSYADDYSSVRGLQQMASQRQPCVVAISHLRKAPAEDPFDEINATMGLLASIDNALVMRSANGLTELHRRGRDYEDDTVLALKGDAQTLLWRVEGDAATVMRSSERKAIIAELPLEGAAKKGMRPNELAEILNKPAGHVRKLLWHMLREDHPAIAKDDKGAYFTLGNGGNAGNGSAAKGSLAGQHADSEDEESVTGGVTALPMNSGAGNAPTAQKAPGQAEKTQRVTGVTGVTSVSLLNESNGHQHQPASGRPCLRCGGWLAPHPDGSGGYAPCAHCSGVGVPA